MGQFPLLQISFEFIKQISKPIANRIKSRAKTNEFFKKYICMPPAQFYHWYDVNLRMRMLGIETKNVAKMTEEAAVTLGADLLGEVIIMSIACGCVAAEYIRRSINDSAKEARHLERLSNMEKQISEYETLASSQSTYISQLEQILQNQTSSSSSWEKKT